MSDDSCECGCNAPVEALQATSTTCQCSCCGPTSEASAADDDVEVDGTLEEAEIKA